MIIGFAGKAATGKTTAARHLAAVLEVPVEIVPMARVLRDEVEAFLRSVGAEQHVPLLYGDQSDKVQVFHVDESRAVGRCPKWLQFVAENRDIQDRPGASAVTVRRILQWWGTEYRRAQDPDYWTKAWDRKIAGLDLDRTLILVDDVRFGNELDMIRTRDGLIVKIERPGFGGANSHSSETSLDGYAAWDGVIVNDGSLEDFRRKAEELIAGFLDEEPLLAKGHEKSV
ncbi:MAG TPA: hypothetical protein VJ910_14690 [Desulfuromonadales bacterium]|nr:hypothetical protein [Desulfuromonadales bacterium]